MATQAKSIIIPSSYKYDCVVVEKFTAAPAPAAAALYYNNRTSSDLIDQGLMPSDREIRLVNICFKIQPYTCKSSLLWSNSNRSLGGYICL